MNEINHPPNGTSWNTFYRNLKHTARNSTAVVYVQESSDLRKSTQNFDIKKENLYFIIQGTHLQWKIRM